MMAEETLSPAEEKKKLGNEAFVAKKFDEAIALYSEAIALDGDNAVYYSNRSACYASKVCCAGPFFFFAGNQ